MAASISTRPPRLTLTRMDPCFMSWMLHSRHPTHERSTMATMCMRLLPESHQECEASQVCD